MIAGHQLVITGTKDEIAFAESVIANCTRPRIAEWVREIEREAVRLEKEGRELRRPPHNERLFIRLMAFRFTGLRGADFGLPQIEGEDELYTK